MTDIRTTLLALIASAKGKSQEYRWGVLDICLHARQADRYPQVAALRQNLQEIIEHFQRRAGR